MTEIGQHLARKLRGLRQQKDWSLDRASAMTGVSKAMLGQIERGESSPTVATLWKIASGFNTSFSGLLTPPSPPLETAIIRPDRGRRANLPQDSLQVIPLFPFEAHFGFELFELTLPPKTTHDSEAHESGVVEHVMVTEGVLELVLEGEVSRLEARDAMRFRADREHRYRNPGTKPVVFHNLIHYPAGVR